MNSKILIFLLVFACSNSFANRKISSVFDSVSPTIESKRWFVVLPLRFTQLQNEPTMLSGIKFGKGIHDRWNASLSIYHSFYLNSFKSPANLSGFGNQPRLFINCMGGEMEYLMLKNEKLHFGIQLHLGWGFMKYDLDAENFESKQVNFLALEPTLNLEYWLNYKTSLSLGVGYRPILSSKKY